MNRDDVTLLLFEQLEKVHFSYAVAVSVCLAKFILLINPRNHKYQGCRDYTG